MSLKAMHIFVICVVVLFSTAANAQQGVPYFSNEDVEKYKRNSDYKIPKTKAVERRNKEEKTIKQKEKEYWCRQGSRHMKNIERAQQEVSNIENEIERLKKEASLEIGSKRTSLDKKIKKAEKKLKQAKKELANREKDLNILENEAHKKGIPPGWLRCQFE